MAYSKGTLAQAGTQASVTSLTCAPTYLAHDVAWAVITYGTGTAIAETITDTAGNAYVKRGSTVVDGPNGQCMAQFVCMDCAAGTPTVTFHLASASSEIGVFVLPISGLDNTATPVGGGQLQSAPGSATDAVSSGNITPSAQPCFFGGLVLNTSDFTTTFTGGTGFTDNGGISSWTVGGAGGASLPPCRYEDARVLSTSAKAATFKASVGSGQNIAIAIAIPEPSAAVSIGSRIRKNTIHPGRHPDRFGKRLRTRRHNTATALSTITGTAAVVSGSDSASAAGSPVVSGTAAARAQSDKASASGQPIISGTAAVVSGADASAASGAAAAGAPSRTARRTQHPAIRGPYNPIRFRKTTNTAAPAAAAITGTAAIVSGGDRAAASGSPVVSGTAAVTSKADSIAATGAPVISGAAAAQSASDKTTASGSPVVSGTAAVKDAGDQAIASQNATTVTGTAAVVSGDDAGAASGTPIISGFAAVVAKSDPISAAGTPKITGLAAVLGAADSVIASGSPIISGSAAVKDNSDLASPALAPITGTGTVISGDDAGFAVGSLPSAMGGGAVIVDLPKKRGRKPKKAVEKALEQAEVSPLIDSPRVITEEEAAGMAAMYGIPERQTETEAPAPQEPEAPAEAGILDGFNPFQTHEASTVAEPTQAPEEPQEEDDIALILAIIEAIG